MMKNYLPLFSLLFVLTYGTFQVSLLTADEIEATVTVSQKAPTAHADMGESKVNDGTVRSFTVDPIFDPEKEALDPESISFSSGGDAAWFHQAGSLTAVEIPTLDSCGDFGIIIKGTIVAKKVEDKSQSSGTSSGGYAFTGSGSYGIKCSNDYSEDSGRTAWNPDTKYLIPYCNVVEGVLYTVTLKVDSFYTLDGLVTEDENSQYFDEETEMIVNGRHLPASILVMPRPSIKSQETCSVCKKDEYKLWKKRYDLEFKETMILLPCWKYLNDAGTKTKYAWNSYIENLRGHEKSHLDDYKELVLENVFQIEVIVSCCKNCNGIKYQNFESLFDNYATKEKIALEKFIVKVIKNFYDETKKRRDGSTISLEGGSHPLYQ